MLSALNKKSFLDLKRRRSRTIFTIITIALSVSAIGLFAVMPMMSDTMARQIEDSNLYDVKLSMSDLNLTSKNIEEIESIDNVLAVEPKTLFFTRMYIGERRNDAVIIGIRDLSDQSVDRIDLGSSIPSAETVLYTDIGNLRTNLYTGEKGDLARIYDSEGSVRELEIDGKGSCLTFSDYPAWGTVALYAGSDLVNDLSNTTGFNMISVDLEDSSEKEAKRTVKMIEEYLANSTDFSSFNELPTIRESDDYPGKDIFEDIMSFFYILAIITMLCSLFLIANSMHTIIIEQQKEIAQMKAVGATNFQIFMLYNKTNLIMGAAGASIGSILGIFIANIVSSFLLDSFFGLEFAFSIHLPVVFASIFIGMLVIIFAGLPALFFTIKIPVRKGLESKGLTNGYRRSLFKDISVIINLLPRKIRMGIRNSSRRRGRSLSTILQVAIAVGLFIGFVSIGHTSSSGIEEIFKDFGSEIETRGQMSGSNPLNESIEPIIEDIEGVKDVEPYISTDGLLQGEEFFFFGYEADNFIYNFERTVSKGRWFTEDDCTEKSNVIVLNRFLAADTGVEIGDLVNVELATGPISFRVIGLDGGFGEWGRSAYAPIDTLQDVLGIGDVISGFGVITDTGEYDEIDRVATEIEDTMMSSGYVVNNYIQYVEWEESREFNKNIINMMIAVGAVALLITLVGLMSTLTMNVIERTKEIGMLRCIGCTSWSIGLIFGVEGLMLSLIGWILGIPTGYMVARFLNYMSLKLMNSDFDLVFPVEVLIIAGIVTLSLTLIVIQPPILKAAHMKTGDALRYE